MKIRALEKIEWKDVIYLKEETVKRVYSFAQRSKKEYLRTPGASEPQIKGNS